MDDSPLELTDGLCASAPPDTAELYRAATELIASQSAAIREELARLDEAWRRADSAADAMPGGDEAAALVQHLNERATVQSDVIRLLRGIAPRDPTGGAASGARAAGGGADAWRQLGLSDTAAARAGGLHSRPSHAQTVLLRALSEAPHAPWVLSAPCGTGKTLVYLLHARDRVDAAGPGAQAVVFCPSDLLCSQVLATAGRLYGNEVKVGQCDAPEA